MTIYDGPDKLAEKIGTYCGQLRNLVIYSTKNTMYVTFTTLKRNAPAQNRGFFGLYEFSESFVQLSKCHFKYFVIENMEDVLYIFAIFTSDFIQESDAEHIRGTE